MAEQQITFKPVLLRASGTPFEAIHTVENPPPQFRSGGGNSQSAWTPQDYTTITQTAVLPSVGTGRYLDIDVHDDYVFNGGNLYQIVNGSLTEISTGEFAIDVFDSKYFSYNNEVLAVVRSSSVQIHTLNAPQPTVASTLTLNNVSGKNASVAVSDDYIVVGQPNNSPGSGGTVKVYDRNGNSLRTITAPGSTYETEISSVPSYQYVTNRNFGGYVAISGDTLFVADSSAGVGGQNYAGIVYAYSLLDGTKLAVVDSIRGTDQYVGTNIVVYGDYLIVPNKRQGKMNVFNVSDFTLQRSIYTTGYNRDGYAISVDISGNYVIVGSRYDTVGSRDYAGRALIYDVRDGSLLAEIGENTTTRFGNFGYAVAIHQNKVFVTSGENAGTIYMYELS